jgi:GAF domain-containing protein
MFLDRLGYLEETFFTFSFSPIYDESGHIAGLFHPVTETTGKIISQRRTRTLRDMAERATRAQTLDEGLALTAQALSGAGPDLPFVLFYKLDQAGRIAHLSAQTGLAPGGPASPAQVDLTADPAGWPLLQVATDGRAILVEDVRSRFPELVCGPYPEPIAAAFVQPIRLPVHERPVCLMVAGVSTRLPLNEAYHSFYELLANAVTTVIANATAYQAERQRAEALAAIDRAKTAFFSNVSHEFRTPLTLLLGPLEALLSEQELESGARERLLEMQRSALRLLRLVNTLLDFARIEAGRHSARFAPTDLALYTADLASTFRSTLEKAGLCFTVDCAPLPAPIYVDRDMWEKIIMNLLSNAFKFTFEGNISVQLAPAPEGVRLSVQDTGTGIPRH